MAFIHARGGNLRVRLAFVVLCAITVILLSSVTGTDFGFSDPSSTDVSARPSASSSELSNPITAGNSNPRIAFVQPIFTKTAYTYAFYNFYSIYRSSTEPFITTDLDFLNVSVKSGWKWSKRLAEFLNSVKAKLAGLSLGQSIQLIDEIDVIQGALFDGNKRTYEVVILGFTEYVTKEEYYFYKQFVATGGTLVIMDACNFLAEVKYHPPKRSDGAGYLSLVRGHGWEFNGTHAWKSVYHRWPEENRNWVGSNFWKYWIGNHYDTFQSNTSHPISTYIRTTYKQNVRTRYGGHEENKLENFTDTQIIGYWHFRDSTEAPEDPVVAYQHRYLNGSVFHTGIMAGGVIDKDEFLQAFLVCAVKMGLNGEVEDWAFWEDSSFESVVSMFYENGTQIPEDESLSGVVTFQVKFSIDAIAWNQTPYTLRSVHFRVSRLNAIFSSQPTIDTIMSREDSLCWLIDVNTSDLFDTEYEFQISCRFTSTSNSSDHVDSTLLGEILRVQNIPVHIWNSLYLGSGLLVLVVVLTCVCLVWRSENRP